jgi:hypothetical protein
MPMCQTGPEDVPEGLLRQMGAYAEMLGAIYPGREDRDGDPVVADGDAHGTARGAGGRPAARPVIRRLLDEVLGCP